jgi:large subunit ribosomal protein L13
LDRLAVKTANIFRERNKSLYIPHLDAGDFAIVINAEKVKLMGAKEDKKNICFILDIREEKNMFPFLE